MASQSAPIVPSRTALRALRRLAFHGTTVFTALGSFCGAATISYDARQRVKFAEKVIDTKRTIRSVSNGRGAAVIQRRFELAERGEDFLLNHATEKRSRKARNHSSVAVEQANLGDSEAPISLHQLPHQPRSRDVQGRIYSWGSALPSSPSDLLANVVKRPTPKKPSTRLPTQSWFDQQLSDFAQITSKPESRWAPRQTKSSNEIQLEELHGTRLKLSNRWGERRGKVQRLSRQEAAPQHFSDREAVIFAIADPADHTGQPPTEPGLTHSALVSNTKAIDSSKSSSLELLGETHPIEEFAGPHRERQKLVNKAVPQPASPLEVTAAERILKASQMTTKFETDFVYARPVRYHETMPLLTSGPAIGMHEGSAQQDEQLATDIGKMGLETDVPTNHGPLSTSVTLSQNADNQTLCETGLSLDLEMKAASANGSGKFQWRETAQGKEARASQPFLEPYNGSLEGEKSLPSPAQPPIAVRSANKDGRPMHTWEDAGLHNVSEPGLTITPVHVDAASPMRGEVGAAHMGVDRFISRFNYLLHLGAVQSAAKSWAVFLKKVSLHTYGSRQHLLQTCRYCQSRLQNRTWRLFMFVKLVEKLFSVDPDSPDAAAILFPLHAAKKQRYESKQIRDRLKSDVSHKTAQRYLIGITESTENPAKVGRELNHVLRAAERCGVRLNEDLFVVALHWYWNLNHIDYAKRLYSTMVESYNVQPTFYTLTVMIRGYAFAGDWARVNEEIEHLHERGVSRKEPVGFSYMFLHVLRAQLIQTSLVQAYDFLLQAITYWGLVPTRVVSTEIIQACIKERRLDILREWVETVRAMFPQVDSSVNNHMSFHVGTAWQQTNASAEEIEETCKAIVFRSTSNPFTPAFRGIVRECVAEDLASALHNDRPGDLGDYLAHAYAIFDKPEIAPLWLRGYSGIISRLHQILNSNTTQDLRRLEYEDQWYNHVPEMKRRKSTVLDNKITSRLPSVLTQEILPSQRIIEGLIRTYYKQSKQEELANGHVVLEFVCQRLSRHGRLAEAGIMLSAMYLDPPANLGRFNIELLSTWLLAAYDTRSLPVLRLALTASLDANRGPERTTERFCLLAKMCMARAQSRKVTGVTDSELEELEWFYRRIVRKKKHDELGRVKRWSTVQRTPELGDGEAGSTSVGVNESMWHSRRLSSRDRKDEGLKFARDLPTPLVGVAA